MPNFRELPACLVTYDIEQAGGAVKLTMTEAHSWTVPDAILAGGRAGWPAILSSLKSVLETGKPLEIKLTQDKERLWIGFNDERGRYHDNHLGRGRRHELDRLWVRIEVVRIIVD